MNIDFRRSPTVSSSLLINNPAVEQVQHYKYLGTVIDDKLAFGPQVDTLCKKKANQRMRKLFAFNVENTFMRMFYSFIRVYWFYLFFYLVEKIIFLKNQEQVAPRGYGLYDLTTMYQSRVLNKTKSCLKLVFLSTQSSSCLCTAVNMVCLFAGPVGWGMFLFQLPLTFITTQDEGCFLCPILYSTWYYQDLFTVKLSVWWLCVILLTVNQNAPQG